MMTRRTIHEVHKMEMIEQWKQATDEATTALRRWQAILKTLASGTGDRSDLQAELARLDRAGLLEWAEWCPVDGGLEALLAVASDGHSLTT